MHTTSCHNPYQSWREIPAGRTALARRQHLLRGLLSGWPRRSRSMLVMNAGNGSSLETLWESGFDVTAHDSAPESLALARARLGPRAEYVLSSPEHLPYDDCFFDYAVAVAALEFWENPEAVLREMSRLACGGLIIIVPNAWSFFGLECKVRKSPLFRCARTQLQSPRTVWKLIRAACGKSKNVWTSVLPGPSATWTESMPCRFLNRLQLPLPFGALLGVRVDFGPQYSGTPLLLRNHTPLSTAK